MNTRKPTKKEVPDDAMCWSGYLGLAGWTWKAVSGKHARTTWNAGDRWLPYSAIPDPTNQPNKKGRKA